MQRPIDPRIWEKIKVKKAPTSLFQEEAAIVAEYEEKVMKVDDSFHNATPIEKKYMLADFARVLKNLDS